jgi:predicted secreted protein
MPLLTGIMVYVLAWWMVFFCVLPFKIESIQKPTDGSMPGAPVNPNIKMKFWITTGIAALVWVLIDLAIRANFISFRDIAERMSM